MPNQSCYLVIAYRFGWFNYGRYFVGCWTDQATAEVFAAGECAGWGGKYGVTVHELTGEEEKVVRHFPSSCGEKEPYINPRIVLNEAVGSRVVIDAEDAKKGPTHTHIPGLSQKSRAAIRRLVEAEQKIVDITHPQKGESDDS